MAAGPSRTKPMNAQKNRTEMAAGMIYEAYPDHGLLGGSVGVAWPVTAECRNDFDIRQEDESGKQSPHSGTPTAGRPMRPMPRAEGGTRLAMPLGDPRCRGRWPAGATSGPGGNGAAQRERGLGGLYRPSPNRLLCPPV